MAIPLPITPSLLNTFLTCPRQYEAKYITKEVVWAQNEAAAYGDRVHKSVEQALTSAAALTPEAAYMQPFVDWCRGMVAQPGMEMLVEQRMAIRRDFTETSWFGKGANTPWLRGIADVFFIDHQRQMNIVVDIKTGKPKLDKTQAQILSLCARGKTGYSKTLTMWAHVRHNQLYADNFDLVTLDPVSTMLLDVARYEKACADNKFPAMPNGLCGNWCDVMNCVHNGKNK